MTLWSENTRSASAFRRVDRLCKLSGHGVARLFLSNRRVSVLWPITQTAGRRATSGRCGPWRRNCAACVEWRTCPHRGIISSRRSAGKRSGSRSLASGASRPRIRSRHSYGPPPLLAGSGACGRPRNLVDHRTKLDLGRHPHLARNFLAAIALACIRLWIKINESTT